MAHDKITFETLIAYATGELDQEAADRVEEHLRVSRTDAEKVSRLQSVIQTMRSDDTSTPPAELLERAKAIFQPANRSAWYELRRRLEEVVAELVFDSRKQPALAGFRGSSDVVQLSYESEVADVDLEITPTIAEGRTTWLLMGQISPHETPAHPIVALMSPSDETFCVEIMPDEHGVFTLHSAPGEYELLIRFADRVVVFPEVTLG